MTYNIKILVLHFSFNLKRFHLNDKEYIFRCIPYERILQKRRDIRTCMISTLIVKSSALYARYSDAINETNVLSYQLLRQIA